MSGASPLIHERFLACAQADPDKPALITENAVISYGSLAEQVRMAASAIDSQQMRRVSISLPNGPEFAQAFFGALAGGAVAMVWDPAWPEQLRDQIAAAHPPDLVADDSWAGWLERQTVTHAIRSQANEDMPFLIGFTSGSSGVPKAFMRSHRSWTSSFEASSIEFGLTADDVVAVPGPMSHGLSLYALAEALCCGATVLSQTRFSAGEFVTLMANHNSSLLVTPPVLLEFLMAQNPAPMQRVRAVITAGDKLQAPARTRASELWPQADVIEYYGASELSFVSVAKRSEGAPSSSVGRAFHGVTIEIRDTAGQPQPPGQEGEVWVMSGMLCQGYISEAVSAFRTDGKWATVGDRGILSEEGWLHLTGRANDMIITAGHNVSPAAVETQIAQVLADPVAVIGLPDPRWGQIVCVVRQGTTAWTEPERTKAAQAVLDRLPKPCVPRAWRSVHQFPRLSSGKLDRRALIEMVAALPNEG